MTLKWLHTPSCRSMRTARRNAAARSTRAARSSVVLISAGLPMRPIIEALHVQAGRPVALLVPRLPGDQAVGGDADVQRPRLVARPEVAVFPEHFAAAHAPDVEG